MGCKCPPGQPKCDCEKGKQDYPAGENPDFATAPDVRSGGVGNTLDRFRAERELPGGLTDWGTRPEWVGFTRPVQNLNVAWDRVDTQPEAVGFHLHRTYVDPDTGTAVSLMGSPVDGGHLFPQAGDDGLPSCGYEFAVGRRP